LKQANRTASDQKTASFGTLRLHEIIDLDTEEQQPSASRREQEHPTELVPVLDPWGVEAVRRRGHSSRRGRGQVVVGGLSSPSPSPSTSAVEWSSNGAWPRIRIANTRRTRESWSGGRYSLQ
jgi:hypothetical protein